MIHLPRGTEELALRVPQEKWHPGLHLDKFIDSPGEGQEAQKEALLKVSKSRGDASLLEEVSLRRSASLDALGSARWRMTTSGPLTLHLSRGNALENAGICLHPVYGFTYLPGTGLKGMARAYAETVWLPAQENAAVADREILTIFGWAPGNSAPAPGDLTREASAAAGTVVFHDAWPEKWPALKVDILNNHHKCYYGGTDDPGDWDDPSMVYFLAIGAGETYQFAVSPRSTSTSEEHLALARSWLAGALEMEGAGAKTSAGYGNFLLEGEQESASTFPSPGRARVDVVLELVTPAFLAGAGQTAADCDLRPATLRGLLRKWWRTLHAGYVDTATLRRLEALVWGDTTQGGAVRVSVRADGPRLPRAFDKHAIVKWSEPKKISAAGIPGCNPKKTTQGLWYVSFGMDEKHLRRHYLAAGTRWTVRLQARGAGMRCAGQKAVDLSAETLLDQASSALWLLCRFGGIGARSRKGFGSLADVDVGRIHSEDGCIAAAGEFRGRCQVHDEERSEAASPALREALRYQTATPWRDPWTLLDQLGFCVQAFAQQRKHDRAKKGLGLPRNLGRPEHGNFRSDKTRHASPVLFHVARTDSGELGIRATGFPSRHLHDHPTNRSLIEQYFEHLRDDMGRRCRENADLSLKPCLSPAVDPDQEVAGERIESGGTVSAVLLVEKTKKGGWRAEHEPTALAGPIVNSTDMPSTCAAGDIVSLIVHSISTIGVMFRWPTARDALPPKQKNKKGGGGGGRKGRR